MTDYLKLLQKGELSKVDEKFVNIEFIAKTVKVRTDADGRPQTNTGLSLKLKKGIRPYVSPWPK